MSAPKLEGEVVDLRHIGDRLSELLDKPRVVAFEGTVDELFAALAADCPTVGHDRKVKGAQMPKDDTPAPCDLVLDWVDQLILRERARLPSDPAVGEDERLRAVNRRLFDFWSCHRRLLTEAQMLTLPAAWREIWHNPITSGEFRPALKPLSYETLAATLALPMGEHANFGHCAWCAGPPLDAEGGAHVHVLIAAVTADLAALQRALTLREQRLASATVQAEPGQDV